MLSKASSIKKILNKLKKYSINSIELCAHGGREWACVLFSVDPQSLAWYLAPTRSLTNVRL